MKKYNLDVAKREIFGKKLKKLRKEGILPANIYGKDITSQAVQLPLKEFEAVYDEAGETGVVYLEFEGKKRPVLIHNVAFHHITHVPLHADFYQVNLKEKIKTMIPVELEGESQAVTDNLGTILQTLNEIEVEALPTELPESFLINVSKLAAIGDQITVADLQVPSGVEVLTDGGQVIVKIAELVAPEPEPEAVAEIPEGEAGTVETEGESSEVTGEATEAKPAE